MMDSNSIEIPQLCMPLLREHRTHYQGDFGASYSAELLQTYNGFASYLPQIDAPKVLDIGCGMAGIDVLLDRHYQCSAKFSLLDKQGASEKINAGFNNRAEDFAHYHDFGAALSLLKENGVSVDGIRCIDIASQKFPRGTFDIVISLLSWGFHYPIATYLPKVQKGGVIIADIRRDTDGEKQLAKYGSLRVVHDAKKYRRVVVQC